MNALLALAQIDPVLGDPVAVADPAGQLGQGAVPVSYTHLTLPTNREV